MSFGKVMLSCWVVRMAVFRSRVGLNPTPSVAAGYLCFPHGFGVTDPFVRCGDSYRLRDKRRSGLLQKAASATPITATE